jgi:hypothetical protein
MKKPDCRLTRLIHYSFFLMESAKKKKKTGRIFRKQGRQNKIWYKSLQKKKSKQKQDKTQSGIFVC